MDCTTLIKTVRQLIHQTNLRQMVWTKRFAPNISEPAAILGPANRTHPSGTSGRTLVDVCRRMGVQNQNTQLEGNLCH